MHNRAAVLVVDDDRHIRAMVRMILEDEGHLVYEASTGQAAVECLQNHPEGLVVLLDLNMPGMNGLDVLHAVAAQSALATRHTYIIMTAAPITADLVQHLAQFAASVLGKPFKIPEFLAQIALAAQRLA